jgi:hypothetical protein
VEFLNTKEKHERSCKHENVNRLDRRFKMELMNTIVENYAAADEGKRLSMFLTYRDLREEFTAIDCSETSRPEIVLSKQKAGSKRERLSNLFSGWGCGGANIAGL